MASKYVALKTFKIGKKQYKRGDQVDVSHLSDLKISQLLNWRYFKFST